jgi:hypothetical protein
MRALTIAIGFFLAATTASFASDITKFWNLTHNTVDGLELAPAGTTSFGPNLCLADPDKSVDNDERLKITGVATGIYDARIHDVTKRSCLAKNVHITAGKIFSIQEKELTDCTQQ